MKRSTSTTSQICLLPLKRHARRRKLNIDIEDKEKKIHCSQLVRKRNFKKIISSIRNELHRITIFKTLFETIFTLVDEVRYL